MVRDAGVSVWVAIDRLDEAFQGFPQVEVPALRALLRTYLDMLDFPKVKLKLFLRRDLFRRIIAGGFVNLTHVNARKFEIIWDEEDLLNLLCRRIRENKEFCASVEIADWPACNGRTSPNSMMCMPPGFNVVGCPGGRSMPARGRIFITPPSIDIVCNSAFCATGVETAVTRSATGETIVK
jgi:hypothetical protein